MKQYGGGTNRYEHLIAYYFHMHMLGVSDVIMFWAFFYILEYATLKWF